MWAEEVRERRGKEAEEGMGRRGKGKGEMGTEYVRGRRGKRAEEVKGSRRKGQKR
jgi:hypothetical protein